MGILDQNSQFSPGSTSYDLAQRIKREQLMNNPMTGTPTGVNPAARMRSAGPLSGGAVAPTPVMDSINSAIQPYTSPLAGSPYKANLIGQTVGGTLDYIGNGIADAAKATGSGIADAASATWDGVTGLFTKGARDRYERNRADLNPDASQYVQQPGVAASMPQPQNMAGRTAGVLSAPAVPQPASSALAAMPQTAASPVLARVSPLSGGVLQQPQTALDAPAFPGKSDPVAAGGGFIRNNRTGNVTAIGTANPVGLSGASMAASGVLAGGAGGGASIAMPQVPGMGQPFVPPLSESGMVARPLHRTITAPVLSGAGGVFGAMNNFAQQAGNTAATIANNKADNTDTRLSLARAAQVDSAANQSAQLQLQQNRMQQEGQQSASKLQLEQQAAQREQQRLDLAAKQQARDQFEVTQIKGTDKDGMPTVTPVMINKARLDANGQPIVMPINPPSGMSGPTSFGSDSEVRDAFRKGRLTQAQAVEALKQFGYK